MTTELDSSTSAPFQMLECGERRTNAYPTLVLALRDMRVANGRDRVNGAGEGNESWIGLSLAMIVLDTLSGDRKVVWDRWKDMLLKHGLSEKDAEIIYRLRCSLLHGYGPPKPGDVSDRKLVLTGAHEGFAVDTTREGFISVSVPLFCGRLVERIAAEAPDDWDVASINTDYPYL